MWGLAEDWGWKSYNLFMAISLQGSSWQRLSTGIYLISVCFPPWSRTEGWGHRSRNVDSLESLFMLGGEHCCWCPAAGLLLETFLSCYVPGESCEWLSCCQHLCSLGQPLSPANSSVCFVAFWIDPQRVLCTISLEGSWTGKLHVRLRLVLPGRWMEW